LKPISIATKKADGIRDDDQEIAFEDAVLYSQG